jgi:hypothetical protein
MSINNTHFTSEEFTKLLDGGYTLKQIESLSHNILYRKAYNKKKYEREKQMKKVLKSTQQESE